MENSVDTELLTGFIDESVESLISVEKQFVVLEESPNDLAIINDIFRPIHSIKGSSAFFGFLKLKMLAHEMETLLDLMRKGSVVPCRENIDVLLEGLDEIKSIFDRVREELPEIEDEENYNKIVQKVVNIRDKKNNIMSLVYSLNAEIEEIREKAIETNSDKGMLESIEQSISILKKLTDVSVESEVINGKENEFPVLNELIEFLTPEIESFYDDNVVNFVLEKLKNINIEGLDNDLIHCLTEMKEEFELMATSCGIDNVVRKMLFDKLVSFKEKAGSADLVITNNVEAENVVTDTPAIIQDIKKKSSQEAGKTMRVAESTIDVFLSYVGELLVVGEMFWYLQEKLVDGNIEGSIISNFRRINEIFSSLSSNLQKSIMGIRKVEIKKVLQKIPRIVRDITTTNGKNVVTIIEGESTQIDKSIADKLEDPMVHIIRNAVDHGIESPEDREKKNKDVKGTLKVSVSDCDENIIILIKDDGKGIDLEALKQKGIDKGLISSNAKLAEQDILDLLFIPGISTAQKITDVSGRGVGMDVVKNNIESLGGKISIKSELGVGSEFSLQIPKSVSTQIIDGFIVGVGHQKYVIPIDLVRESFQINTSEISTIAGKKECVKRRNEVIPLVRLDNLFESNSINADDNLVLVTIEQYGKKIVFCVDELLGVQQVVLKKITGFVVKDCWFKGAALMGDGDVAMIIDVEHIFQTEEI